MNTTKRTAPSPAEDVERHFAEERRKEKVAKRTAVALRKVKEARDLLEGLAQEAATANDWPLFGSLRSHAHDLEVVIGQEDGTGLQGLVEALD